MSLLGSRLHKLLSLRKNAEEERKLGYAHALKEEADAQARLVEAKDLASRWFGSTGPGRLRLADVQLSVTMLESFCTLARRREQELALCQHETARRRDELLAATRERKVLENLLTRHMSEYFREVQAIEQREQDDRAAARYGR
ncbi:MAG: hypothetical protein AB1497_05260 [Bacillota bacterium]